MRFIQGFLVGSVFFSLIAAAVPIPFSSVTIPVQAAVDAVSITYQKQGANWFVRGPVCPRVDSTVISGLATIPCIDTQVAIAAPSGAFLAQLKADFKLVVLASGYPSGD